MKFTIGYIDHNKEVFDNFLGKSIKNLKGDFDVIFESDEKFPAENYNRIIKRSKTDWIILTHQDISFSSDLLDKIELTINTLNEKNISFSALGIVGPISNSSGYEVKWSSEDKIYQLETCDCCFIVVNKNIPIRFDQEIFNEYHLYVEDYCVAASQYGGIFTIGGINAFESTSINELPQFYILHHSSTVAKKGFAWGRYGEFKRALWNKWNKQIKTT